MTTKILMLHQQRSTRYRDSLLTRPKEAIDHTSVGPSDLGKIILSRFNKYRLIHGHFHIGLVIIPRPPYWPETQSRANMGRGMITRPIWKCPCIKLFITYFQHLEKRHPYCPETKSRPILARAIWASIWK